MTEPLDQADREEFDREVREAIGDALLPDDWTFEIENVPKEARL